MNKDEMAEGLIANEATNKEILHLSLRLQGLSDNEEIFGQTLTNLGIAIYFIFGDRENPINSEEYGMAFLLPNEKYAELMRTGEVFIVENNSIKGLKENEKIPKGKL